MDDIIALVSVKVVFSIPPVEDVLARVHFAQTSVVAVAPVDDVIALAAP
jgi:hypothetical protein